MKMSEGDMLHHITRDLSSNDMLPCVRVAPYNWYLRPLRGPYEIHKGLYKIVKSSLRVALIQTGRGRASHCTACEFRRVENAARVKQKRESRERERARETAGGFGDGRNRGKGEWVS
jgi:hypothetical protein